MILLHSTHQCAPSTFWNFFLLLQCQPYGHISGSLSTFLFQAHTSEGYWSSESSGITYKGGTQKWLALRLAS
jgi:hypothetical protein